MSPALRALSPLSLSWQLPQNPSLFLSLHLATRAFFNPTSYFRNLGFPPHGSSPGSPHPAPHPPPQAWLGNGIRRRRDKTSCLSSVPGSFLVQTPSNPLMGISINFLLFIFFLFPYLKQQRGKQLLHNHHIWIQESLKRFHIRHTWQFSPPQKSTHPIPIKHKVQNQYYTETNTL